jgi:hypothetical protein
VLTKHYRFLNLQNRNQTGKTLTFLALILSTLPTPSSAWEVTNSEDGFGTKRVLALTYYDQDLQIQYPDEEPTSSRFAALALRCMESKLDVVFASYLDGVPVKWIKQSTVEVKFDNGKIEKWKISFPPDKSGIFFTDSKKLVSRLLRSETIAIRGSGLKSRITANFDVSNLAETKNDFRGMGCIVK